MVDNNTANKKKSLFLRIFSSGYILPALLIFSLAFSFVIINNQYSVLNSLTRVNANMKTFILALVGIAFLLIAVYFATEVKSGKIRLADAIAFAMILFGIAFALYTYLSFNAITLNVIIASALSVCMGFIYLLFRGHYFKNSIENDGITYELSPAKSYFKAINHKYSFLTVIISTLVIYSACTLGLSKGMQAFTQSALERIPYLRYFFYVTAIFGLFYLYSSVVKKTLNFIDVVLTSCLIVFPILIFRILFLNETGSVNLFIVLIAIGVYLITFILRILFLNVRKKNKETQSKKCYLSKVASKYGIFQTLFFATFIVTFLAYALSTDLVANLVVKSGKVTTVNRNVFALCFLAIVGAGTYLTALVCSIINLKSVNVGLGDALNNLLLITSLLSLTVNLVYSSLTYLIVSGVLSLFAIIVWIVKIAKSK